MHIVFNSLFTIFYNPQGTWLLGNLLLFKWYTAMWGQAEVAALDIYSLAAVLIGLYKNEFSF